MKALIFLGLVIAQPVLAADKFDLICKAKKANERYRIDLVRGEYCLGDCATVKKITEVTQTALVLERIERAYPGDKRMFDQVNRTTGEWVKFIDYGRTSSTSTLISGTCEPAEFSGFPATKF